MPESRPKSSQRLKVVKRANYCCEYCQSQERYSPDSFSIENIGLTPTGRATIEKLQLNRSGLVNLRRILFAVNEHPPKLT